MCFVSKFSVGWSFTRPWTVAASCIMMWLFCSMPIPFWVAGSLEANLLGELIFEAPQKLQQEQQIPGSQDIRFSQSRHDISGECASSWTQHRTEEWINVPDIPALTEDQAWSAAAHAAAEATTTTATTAGAATTPCSAASCAAATAATTTGTTNSDAWKNYHVLSVHVCASHILGPLFFFTIHFSCFNLRYEPL